MSSFKDLAYLFIIINIGANIKTIGAGSVPGHRVCLTETCVVEAAKLINSIDKNVSPCDDFYKFVCGKWIQNKPLPDHKSNVNRFGDLQDELNTKLKDLILKTNIKTESRDFIKNTKRYFKSCLNTTRLEELGDKPLRDVFKQFGDWPLVSKTKKKELEWIDIYLKLRQLGLGPSVLFTITIDTDLLDNSRRILTIDQPSFGLGSRDSVLKGPNDPSVKAYKNLIASSALKLGEKSNSPDLTADEIFNFETLMANKSMAKELRRNMTAIYNKTTIKQLTKMAPNINWIKLIKGYLNSDNITEEEEIILFDTKYIKYLNEFLPDYSNRFLVNYMLWRVVRNKMSTLNEDWLLLKEKFDSIVSGTKRRAPRWETCISKVQSSFGIALSHLYVTNFFSDEDKEKASEMFTNVVKEFRRSLNVNTWMADKTRTEALKKLDNMKLLVGYPNELLNESIISEYYKGLRMDSLDYFGNNARIKKWSNDMEIRQLRETVDPFDWRELSSVAAVNAYYHPGKNLVLMPAGILQGVFFNKDRPNYLNYGSIAYISGHEIIHGFDDGGRQFDSIGNLRNWWDNETDQLYTEKSKCIINQYNNFRLIETNQKLNGVNTQGENIADNGGVLQSYRAYLNYVEQYGPEAMLPALDYTPEQLFWINSAVHWCSKATNEFLKLLVLNDGHSPSRARTNLVVSNSAEFSEAFNCPLGTPMNPPNKCNIW